MLLPIADSSIGIHWTIGTGTDAYALLDEGNAHNAGIDVVTCTNSGSLGGELKLGFALPSGPTSSLKLRIYSTTGSCDITATLYINGVAFGTPDVVVVPDNGGSGNWSEYTWSNPWTSITTLEVGFKITNTFSSAFIDSVYFEPTVYIEACTATYKAPNHIYLLDEPGTTSVCLDTGGSSNGTYSGSLVFGASSIANDGGTSVRFSGGKIILPASGFQGYTAFTFSCWCIWTGGAEGQRLFDFGNYTGQKYYYFTPNHPDTNKPRFGLSLTGTAGEVKLDSLDEFPLNQRVFVTCSYDGTRANLYINGVLKSSKVASISLSDVAPSLCYIGGHPLITPSAFLGAIDRITIHGEALSKSNVEAIVACLKTEPAVGYLGVEEALIISDTVRVNLVWSRGVADNINLSDNKGPKKALSDSLSFGETTRSVSRLTPQVKDTFELSEYAQAHNGLISQRTDLINFVGTVKAYKTLVLSDTLALTDDLSQPGIKWQVLGHTLALNDTLRFEIPGKFYPFVTDILSLIDSVTRTSNRYTLRDQLYIVDSVLESGVPERVLTTEVITFSETLRTNLYRFKVIEPLTFTDTVRSKFARITVKDTLNLVESLHVSPFKIKLDADLLTFNDSVSFVTNHPFLRETLTLTDIVKFRLAIVNKRLSDTLTLIEKLAYFPNPVRITDTLTLTDRVNRTFPRSFVDTLTLIDTARRFFGNAFVDTLTLNETLVASGSKRLSDVLLLLDTLCCVHSGKSVISDSLNLQTYLTYSLNDGTTAPTLGDSGFGVSSTYNIQVADELLLDERIKNNAPPCNGPFYDVVVEEMYYVDEPTKTVFIGFLSGITGNTAIVQSFAAQIGFWLDVKIMRLDGEYVEADDVVDGGEAGDNFVVLQFGFNIHPSSQYRIGLGNSVSFKDQNTGKTNLKLREQSGIFS